MACVYKRRKQYWISYYVNGQQIRQSLHTTNERVALARKKRIEYELSLGDLQMASQLPLVLVLEAFCKYLESTRTFKSFKNDFSRLRAFFGPICQSLESCPPGVKRGQQTMKTVPEPIMTELSNHVATLSDGQERLFTDRFSPKKWERVRRAVGLRNLKFHDLRKTFASLLAQRGVSTAVTQRLLEHSSPQLTNDVYTNVDPVLRQAIDRLPVADWIEHRPAVLKDKQHWLS